jgi:hypothetical protein
MSALQLWQKAPYTNSLAALGDEYPLLIWEICHLEPTTILPCTSSHNAYCDAYCTAWLHPAVRYTLHPSGMAEFLQLSADTAELRGKLLPFLG